MVRKLATAAMSLLFLLLGALLVYALLVRRDLFPLAFAIAFPSAFLWIVGNVVASVIHRRRAGKFILTPRFPGALFHERWISGLGHKKVLRQRVGASNCLWVAVLPERIRVGDMFPFNLMFLPERLGLEYDIPAARVTSVSQTQPRRGRVSVSVRFRDADGEETEFDLFVRDSQAFITAIHRITNDRVAAEPTTP